MEATSREPRKDELAVLNRALSRERKHYSAQPAEAAKFLQVGEAPTLDFALVAVAGTRDALRFNESVRDTWQALVDSGVQPSDIDAGYAWTGWTLYAHPENLSKGFTVQDVPWVTSKRRPTYILAKGAITGYDVVREVAWTDDAPWPGPDRLLILKRQVQAASN